MSFAYLLCPVLLPALVKVLLGEASGISGFSVFSLASNLLTELILLHHHASGIVNDQLGQALTTSTVDTESPHL